MVGWLLVQIATQVFPFCEIPNWAVRLVVLTLIIGFPVAFEITPEGIRRSETVAGRPKKRKGVVWIAVAVVGAALSMVLFFLGRYTAGQQRSKAPLSGPSVPEKSIAVLPFDNLSDDKANAYFAEGMQEEILTRLAKIADLKVISRTSTQRFKSVPSDLRISNTVGLRLYSAHSADRRTI